MTRPRESPYPSHHATATTVTPRVEMLSARGDSCRDDLVGSNHLRRQPFRRPRSAAHAPRTKVAQTITHRHHRGDRTHRPIRLAGSTQVTHSREFFTDLPIRVIPISWQDTGSGVITFGIRAFVLSYGPMRNDKARDVANLALATGLVAFLVDVYL